MNNKPVGSEYDKQYYDSGETWYKGLSLYSDGPGNLRDCINNVMQVRHFFPEAKSLLDIGAGKGHFVLAARMAGFNAWGLEISKYAIEQAPSEVASYISSYNGEDIYSIQTPDVVTSMFVHEHLTEAGTIKHLLQIERIAKMGLVMRLPIVPPYMSVEEYRKTDKDPTHINTQKLEYWLELIPATTDLVFSACWYTNNPAGGSRATIVFKKAEHWNADKSGRDPFPKEF